MNIPTGQPITKTVGQFIGHYLYGIFAAGWNGGWNAVAGIVGVDVAGLTGATADSRILNLHEMLWAFMGSFVIHGLLWLKAHPIPDKLSDDSASP